jgi:hypothetical protein
VKVVHMQHATVSGAGGFPSVSYGARCGAPGAYVLDRPSFISVCDGWISAVSFVSGRKRVRPCASCARLAGIEIKGGDHGDS